MAMRGTDGRRTEKADQISVKLDEAMKPIFKEAMKCGITPEEFCYLAHEEADMLGMTYLRHKYSDNKGGNHETN